MSRPSHTDISLKTNSKIPYYKSKFYRFDLAVLLSVGVHMHQDKYSPGLSTVCSLAKVATSSSAPNGYRVYQTRPTPMRELTNVLQNGQDWYDDLNDAKLKRLGRDLYLSFFQSGVSARIQARSARNNDYFLDLFVKVPQTLGLRISGFLGSPDGDRGNDLFARGENNAPLPLNYRDRDLYPHLVTCKKTSLYSSHACLLHVFFFVKYI